MLKSDFHTHSKCSTDDLNYSAKQLIKRAAKLGYEVLALTNHNCNIYEQVKGYARKNGILLIPGAEINIGSKHVLVLNTKKGKELQDCKDFEALKKENMFLIAPHPFFPHPSSIGMKFFMQHKHLFDALEYSWFYTKNINFNNKVIDAAKKYKISVVANSDCHSLNVLDRNYTLVDADKRIDSVLEAIRKNKIKIATNPLNGFQFFVKGMSIIFSDIIGLFSKK
jgi:predicted metal-dependent phosphoesterase TrpH